MKPETQQPHAEATTARWEFFFGIIKVLCFSAVSPLSFRPSHETKKIKKTQSVTEGEEEPLCESVQRRIESQTAGGVIEERGQQAKQEKN